MRLTDGIDARRPRGLRAPTLLRAGRLQRLLAGDESAQALVLLAACRATGEVRAKPGHAGIGVGSGELQLDVAIEVVEALVAAELGLALPQEPGQRLLEIRAFHHVPSSFVGSIATPRRARCRRSFARASCSVLYSAPRVVSRRSASTSIGTPFSATATSTVRWCGVRASRSARFSSSTSSRSSA